ncbi:MAG: hypothetical protein ACI9WU_003388 [Myxococcota bacterium]|jgi:hypothetical protein
MRPMKAMVTRLLLVLLLGGSFAGCELLNKVSVPGQTIPETLMPELELTDTTLVSSPTVQDIAAWYCPLINPDPTGLTCQLALGPAPAEHEMQFHFELRYLVDNPNEFPIPTTEILAAINVFEGTASVELGAVCTVLCNEGDIACTGEPGENSCKSDIADIESIGDLEHRVVDLIFLTLDAAINGELENLFVRMIPAGSENFEVRVRFSLGVNAMIDIMRNLVNELVADVLSGATLAFEIPFSVRGTLWFEVPVLGRIALGYGPFADTWVLEP